MKKSVSLLTAILMLMFVAATTPMATVADGIELNLAGVSAPTATSEQRPASPVATLTIASVVKATPALDWVTDGVAATGAPLTVAFGSLSFAKVTESAALGGGRSESSVAVPAGLTSAGAFTAGAPLRKGRAPIAAPPVITLAAAAAVASPQSVPAAAAAVVSPQSVPAAAADDPMSIPVLIVHGTWSNPLQVEPLKANLEAQGFTVYSFLYGQGISLVSLIDPTVGGIGDINVSVTQLAAEIAQVRVETGSQQINLVGHSQGGLLIKDYLEVYNDTDVEKVVDLGASNHGTTFAGGAIPLLQFYLPDLNNALATIFGEQTVAYFTSGRFLLDFVSQFPAVLQPAARWAVDRFVDFTLGIAPRQQLSGSSFITALNTTPDTKPDVDYLVIGTRNDGIVTPYESTYLSAVPGADVRNVEVHTLPGVQQTDVITHDDLVINGPVAQAAGEFLATPSPAPHPDTGVTTTVDGGTTTVTVVTVTGAAAANTDTASLSASSVAAETGTHAVSRRSTERTRSVAAGTAPSSRQLAGAAGANRSAGTRSR